MILAYMAVSGVVTTYTQKWVGLDARLVEPLLLLVLASTLPPVVSRLEELVEGYLSRDRREGRVVIQNLSRDIVTLLDLETLAGRLTHALGESLLLENCVLFGRDEATGFTAVAAFDRRIGVRTGGELALDSRLSACGRSLRAEALGPTPVLTAQVVDTWPEDTPDAAQTFLDAAGGLEIRLLVPVRHRDDALGVIALGKKLTGGRFTREDLLLLETLANQTGAAMRTASLYAESVRRAALEEELSLARQIQFRYLPTAFPTLDNLEVFGMNQPSKQVGGDYFDVVEGEDGFLTAIADVSGKGVPAALVMSMMQASLRTQAEEGRPVSEILARINRLMLARGETGMFATCFLGRLDQHTLELVYCNAGHNHPILLRADGRVEMLDRGGLLLGVFDDPRLEEGRVKLLPGDRLVLYTDGVTEARAPNGDFYGEERLNDLLMGLEPGLSAETIASAVREAVGRFAESEDFEDDMTLVVVRVPERRPAAVEALPEDRERTAEPVLAPSSGA
jgi:serine phosphatase RsbU (regulator of sigma subunit)